MGSRKARQSARTQKQTKHVVTCKHTAGEHYHVASEKNDLVWCSCHPMRYIGNMQCIHCVDLFIELAVKVPNEFEVGFLKTWSAFFMSGELLEGALRHLSHECRHQIWGLIPGAILFHCRRLLNYSSITFWRSLKWNFCLHLLCVVACRCQRSLPALLLRTSSRAAAPTSPSWSSGSRRPKATRTASCGATQYGKMEPEMDS